MSSVLTSRSDEHQMTAYVQGDSRAFDALFRRYAPALARYFSRHAHRACDVDDLVQQTFLQLHRARGDYRPGEAVRPWLFTIARNVSCDQRRRHQRRPEALCDVDLNPAPETELGALVRAQRLRVLAAALEQLAAEHKSLLCDHFLQERSFTEIASDQGAHAGTLRVRAHRACVQLRQLIDIEGGAAA